jgi:hypothetical protein
MTLSGLGRDRQARLAVYLRGLPLSRKGSCPGRRHSLFDGDAPVRAGTAAGGCFANRALRRAPVVRLLLVVEMANAGDVRRVAILLGPINCFVLSLEARKRMIGVVFNDIVGNRASFGSSLRMGFNKNGRHGRPLDGLTLMFLQKTWIRAKITVPRDRACGGAAIQCVNFYKSLNPGLIEIKACAWREAEADPNEKQ